MLGFSLSLIMMMTIDQPSMDQQSNKQTATNKKEFFVSPLPSFMIFTGSLSESKELMFLYYHPAG